MIVQAVVIVSAVKLLFMPLYHSTDFEVHRNWLAITHNRSIDKWYYEDTSEWTLDYPPFFAWFEFALSHIAKYFDPEMLKIDNLNYASENTVIFQRLSVIATDIIYVVGVKSCTDLLSNGNLLAFILLIANPGLLMVDHIHFQYNGFLFGLLLFSISHMIRGNHLKAAFWFAVLLNFKHIFLYMAPAYFVYLLRAHCFTVSSRDGVTTAWYSFSYKNLVKLAVVVTLVFGVSFGPFVQHLPQIASRLFPFKRGLSHAYWAPNFWALYNFTDKILYAILWRLGLAPRAPGASMTSGLVREYSHAVLPRVTPAVTFALTAAATLPALVKMWRLGADKSYRVVNFVRCLVVCATSSFMFGWHVHEKAILMILIPLTFVAHLGSDDGRLYLFLSVIGHYSLFPLLHPRNLFFIKIFTLLTFTCVAFSNIPKLYEGPRRGKKLKYVSLPVLNLLESALVQGLFWVCLYDTVLHSLFGLSDSLPFLPLMMTSVYCAIGVLYFWISYYHYFLTFNLSTLASTQPKFYDKKVN